MCGIILPFYVKNPREGRYLSSYVLNPYYDRESTKDIAIIIGIIFEFWFISSQWGGLVIQLYINCLYLKTVSTSMRYIKSINPTGWGKVNREKAFVSKLRAYSKLRILATMYNQTVGFTFLPRFQSTSALVCVCSSFVFIKVLSSAHNPDGFVIGLSGFGMIIFGFSFFAIAKYCSRVHEESLSLLEYLLTQKTPGSLANKEMICYKPIGVNIGSYYLVKKETPLTMSAVVSNVTMTMLISNSFSL